MLNRFALRWLHDSSIPFAAFSAGAFRVPGTLIEAKTLPPNAGSLLRARTLLRSGGVVAVMIDRMDPAKGEFVEIRVGNRVMWISDALIKLAMHQRSRIVFFASKLNSRGYPVVAFRASRTDSSCAETIDQFASFVSDIIDCRASAAAFSAAASP
jgi:hypothetical protein